MSDTKKDASNTSAKMISCMALNGTRHVVLAVLLLGLSACGTAPPAATVTPSSPLSPDAAITVMPFAPPESVISYEGDTETLGHDFARHVVSALAGRGYTVQLDDAPNPETINVAGRLVRLDGGSHAARFWVGFGAGRSSLSVEGTVTGPDGRELGAFRERRSSSGAAELGFSGDDYLMDKCLRVLARDVAEMVASGSYRVAAVD